MRLSMSLLPQLALALFLLLLTSAHVHGYGLEVGYYKRSCPAAEAIVRETVFGYFSQDPTVTAPLLRLHFHDCFVRGCDGSVLINSTKGNKAEKDAKPNHSLDGFFVIDAAKAALEKKCPGVVSCADVVALVARDAVSLATAVVRNGGWTKDGNLYEVETGRRDGRVSHAAEAVDNLPSPFFGIFQLKTSFASKGLDMKDLAVLSGAHAIGNSHCNSFARRLYNFTGKGDMDPSLDPAYAAKLKQQCKPGDLTTILEMVPGSSTTFDTTYYQLVAERRGLFHSDEALLRNKETRDYVYSHINSETSFFKDFGVSMVRMGRAGVLTGYQGEIRKNCALVN
ncbi:peroxidase 56-like [Typha angustifolia]|uniref:peroxidase 56-like n=1 Tax=Typha angustifolia TaxID=59011 RepID=UPI003C2B6E9D